MLKKILSLAAIAFVAFAVIGAMMTFAGAVMHRSVFLFCLFMAVVLSLVAMVIDLKKVNDAIAKKKILNYWLKFLFAVYCVFLVLILFFYGDYRNTFNKMNVTLFSKEHFEMCNFVPFATVIKYIEKYLEGRLALSTAVENIAVNIVLFMPMGFFFATILKKINNFGKFFGCILAMIVFAEVVQLVTMCGVFDVDDIILNLFGAVIAYLISKTNTVKNVLDKIARIKN